MLRIGCCTGKIYDVSDFKKGIDECCILLPIKYENDISKIKKLRIKANEKCRGCFGCPESHKK